MFEAELGDVNFACCDYLFTIQNASRITNMDALDLKPESPPACENVLVHSS